MKYIRKTKIIAIIAIILVVTFFGNILISFAETKSELEEEQKQTSDKIKNAQNKQNEIKKEMTTIKQEVENLNNQISNYENEIFDLTDQITETSNNIQTAEKEIEKTQKDLEEKEELLEKRLVASYKAGDTSYLDVLLDSENLTTFLSNYYMIEELAKFDSELIETVRQTKKELEDSKKILEESKIKLEETKKIQEEKISELNGIKNQKNAKVSELSTEEKNLQKEIDELKNHESSVRNRIIQMQKEYDAQKRSSSGNSSNNSNGGTSSYGFGWPVSNHSIGTGYGVSGSYWSSGHHTGVDFPVSTGTPVYAVGDGQVFDTGYNSAYGNFVEIYHGNNIYSFYAHASSVNVSVGQKVTKGQKIMSSGKSGNVTGPHLHFEIRTPGYRYADCVNPMKYLP